jgi:hypothetical protein
VVCESSRTAIHEPYALKTIPQWHAGKTPWDADAQRLRITGFKEKVVIVESTAQRNSRPCHSIGVFLESPELAINI